MKTINSVKTIDSIKTKVDLLPYDIEYAKMVLYIDKMYNNNEMLTYIEHIISDKYLLGFITKNEVYNMIYDKMDCELNPYTKVMIIETLIEIGR